MPRKKCHETEERDERLFEVYLAVLKDYNKEVAPQLTKRFICEKVKEKGPFFINYRTVSMIINRKLEEKGYRPGQIPYDLIV